MFLVAAMLSLIFFERFLHRLNLRFGEWFDGFIQLHQKFPIASPRSQIVNAQRERADPLNDSLLYVRKVLRLDLAIEELIGLLSPLLRALRSRD